MTQRPTLIFDGDCGFCRTWIEYWKSLTGDRVEYLDIDHSRRRFPDLFIDDLRKRVHVVTSERVYAGAEAVFRSLADVPGYGWLLWLYRFVPGFAEICELFYRIVAGNRGTAMAVTRALWGDRVVRSEYTTAALMFSRALSFVYLIALASVGMQVRGLIGSEGILPVGTFFEAARAQLGFNAPWRLPSVFWWADTDFALLSIAWGGVALAAVSVIAKPWGKWQRTIFAILFVYYLSFVSAGQVFMGFQWDYLLLETGFLALFLRPERGRVWLFQWLLFRLMFESGAVKLLTHDPSWRNLTALDVHFETQPLPTLIGWYAHQLPGWIHKAFAVVMFAIELVLPFFIFGPRRMKQMAGFGIALLQVTIALTGNYTFFNLLTLALCLLLFDDTFFRRWFKPQPRLSGPASAPVSATVTTGILALSAISLAGVFVTVPPQLESIIALESSYGIVNRYGLFSVMTTTRPEIQIEGSLDGEHWLPYKFRYKPGNLENAPRWVAPFQPRLDWQMWFAALGNLRQNPWFARLVLGLLQGSKPVLDLLEPSPFGPNPPKFVRARVYEYHFTNLDEHARTGDYWKRELKGEYFPPAGLRGQPLR